MHKKLYNKTIQFKDGFVGVKGQGQGQGQKINCMLKRPIQLSN